jgi:hypothetical protein
MKTNIALLTILVVTLLLSACGNNEPVGPTETPFPYLYTAAPTRTSTPTLTPQLTATPEPSATPLPEAPAKILEKGESVTLFRSADGAWVKFYNSGPYYMFGSVGCTASIFIDTNLLNAKQVHGFGCGTSFREAYTQIKVASSADGKIELHYLISWEVK